jgi:hypothetical protein
VGLTPTFCNIEQVAFIFTFSIYFMLINAGGKKYSVRFFYGPKRKFTQCIVKDVETEEQFHSTVIRHPKDPDNKAEARRFALARTLKQITQNKEIRRQFWTDYSSQIRESFPVQ